jgi:Trk K+ transport system NAD-binding subunit
VGLLPPRSSWIGRTVQSCVASKDALEIIAILRGGEIVLPHSDTKFQQNDRILVIASNSAQSQISEDLVSVRAREAIGSIQEEPRDRV